LQPHIPPVPVKDTWFDVAIVRTGTSKVKVRIGNEDVLAYDQLPGAPQDTLACSPSSTGVASMM
jgi:hypothetical protein